MIQFIDPESFDEDRVLAALIVDLRYASAIKEAGPESFINLIKRITNLNVCQQKVLMKLFVKRMNFQIRNENVYRVPFEDLLKFMGKLEEGKYVCLHCEKIFKAPPIHCKKCGSFNVIYKLTT